MRALQAISAAILALGAIAGMGLPAASKTVTVRGYVQPKTGHYVAPHIKTAPDHTRQNNYSTKGNVNPFTGKPGSKR